MRLCSHAINSHIIFRYFTSRKHAVSLLLIINSFLYTLHVSYSRNTVVLCTVSFMSTRNRYENKIKSCNAIYFTYYPPHGLSPIRLALGLVVRRREPRLSNLLSGHIDRPSLLSQINFHAPLLSVFELFLPRQSIFSFPRINAFDERVCLFTNINFQTLFHQFLPVHILLLPKHFNRPYRVTSLNWTFVIFQSVLKLINT